MKKEVFELCIGENFLIGQEAFTCIRSYGNADNVLAIRESDKKMVKFPPYAACIFSPKRDRQFVLAKVAGVNDVIRCVYNGVVDMSETFLVLENEGNDTELRVKVLESGHISSIQAYQNIEVMSYGTSNT